jgi:hypothetical protein
MKTLLSNKGRFFLIAMALSLLSIQAFALPQDKVTKLDEYVGEYRADEKGVVFTKDGGKLFVQKVGDEHKIELIANGEDKFNAPAVEAEFVFNRNDKKKISGVTLKIEGREIPLERVK